jgi:hypothetical protein
MANRRDRGSGSSVVMPDDWAVRCVAALETEESMGRRAVMLQKGIEAFGREVARRFKPGSSIYVRWRPPGSPGLSERPSERLPGTVCRSQTVEGEIASWGLLVHLDPSLDGRMDLWRLWHITDVGNVYRFHFWEIDEVATRCGVCVKCGAALCSAGDGACMCRPCSRAKSVPA